MNSSRSRKDERGSRCADIQMSRRTSEETGRRASKQFEVLSHYTYDKSAEEASKTAVHCKPQFLSPCVGSRIVVRRTRTNTKMTTARASSSFKSLMNSPKKNEDEHWHWHWCCAVKRYKPGITTNCKSSPNPMVRCLGSFEHSDTMNMGS